jgi:hypothetical protein
MENTETDPRISLPSFGNDVIRLRQWGSDHVYPLPSPSEVGMKMSGTWSVGASEECNLQIHDPTRRTSRRHATLMREHAQWSLVDVGSKNGLHVDGVRQTTALLGAGQEIRIGGVTLIAESVRIIVLRDFLARILGWDGASAERVDVALHAIRTAEVKRRPLVLRGEGDLVPLSVQFHRRIFGDSRPFTLCDPKRKTTEANARSVPNELSVIDAIDAARGGTLVLRENRLPSGYRRALRELRTGDSISYLIMCGGRSLYETEDVMESLVVRIPPLSQRQHELERVVHEYLVEAGQALQTKPVLDRKIVDWIIERSARTLPEIEKAALRLTAMTLKGSILDAADLLHIASVSLRRWMSRRSFPPVFPTKDPES